MLRFSASFVALTAAAVLLCGCSTANQVNNCPLATALVDAGSMTVFPTGGNSTRPLYTVQVAKVDSDCTLHKYEHNVSTDLEISFTASRPAGGAAREYDVTYFVATTQGSRIINKRRYRAHFGFEDGATTAAFSASVDSAEITIEKAKKGYDYALIVGFPLTKEQLDYNRTVGRYPK